MFKTKARVRVPKPERRTQGIAMVAALALMAVASMVMVLLFTRTMDELRHGQDDAAIVQTLLVAHGGANLGNSLLRNDVRYAMDTIVTRESDTTGSWSFGTSDHDENAPRPGSVASDLEIVASSLQYQIDTLLCGGRELSDGAVLTVRIHVTEEACDQELPEGIHLGDGRFVSGSRREMGGNQTYALPFVMVSDGVIGEFRRRVVTQGEYQFEVGRRSFARYALFTDEHAFSGSSSRIWFTSSTLFDGPVHTNGNFNFRGRPWFGGAVSSAGIENKGDQGAYAYNGGNGDFRSATNLEKGGNAPNMDANNWTNRPQFADGVDWRSDYIELPENAFDQEKLAKENGLYIDLGDVEYFEMWAADSGGDPIDAGQESTYQYFELGRSCWKCETVTWRLSQDGVLEQWVEDSEFWSTVTSDFNGVVYIDDYVPRLRGPGRAKNSDPATARPAVAAFAQLTIVPEGGARITSDLVYEDQPCTGYLHRDSKGNIVQANCDNFNAYNVLGIFAPTSNVMIGHNHGKDDDRNAPEDVRIQASILTSDGVVAVEDYNKGSDRGAVRLLGGIIEKNYGAFGTFDPGSEELETGFYRQFTFDPRLAQGLTPPYFPTVGIDGVSDVRTFTFGHREQVYEPLSD